MGREEILLSRTILSTCKGTVEDKNSPLLTFLRIIYLIVKMGMGELRWENMALTCMRMDTTHGRRLSPNACIKEYLRRS